jgi:hypothetical protein
VREGLSDPVDRIRIEGAAGGGRLDPKRLEPLQQLFGRDLQGLGKFVDSHESGEW